jgi:hypothetical protein
MKRCQFRKLMVTHLVVRFPNMTQLNHFLEYNLILCFSFICIICQRCWWWFGVTNVLEHQTSLVCFTLLWISWRRLKVTSRFDIIKWTPVKLTISNIIASKSENTFSTTNKYVLCIRGRSTANMKTRHIHRIYFSRSVVLL